MTLTPHEDLNSYSPELLISLEQAFKAVWQTLYAHMPVEGDNARELQITLSRTLVSWRRMVSRTPPISVVRRALVPHPASLPLSFKECLKFVTVARWSPMRSLERIERAQHLGDFGRLIRHFNTPSIAFAAAPSSCASGQFSSPCHYLRDHFAGPNRGYTARNPSISLSTKTSCRREGWLHFHFSTPSIAFAAAASARPSGGRTRPASCWPSYRGMRGTGRSSEEADAQQKLRTECN